MGDHSARTIVFRAPAFRLAAHIDVDRNRRIRAGGNLVRILYVELSAKEKDLAVGADNPINCTWNRLPDLDLTNDELHF